MSSKRKSRTSEELGTGIDSPPLGIDPDIDEILPTLAESARRIAHADLSVIALTDGPDVMRVVAAAGERRDGQGHLGLTFSATRGTAAEAIRTGKPYQSRLNSPASGLARTTATSRLLESEQIQVNLAVPVRRGEEIIGVIRVASREDRDFTSAESELLELLAKQAAVAIDTTRLYARERAARAEADALAAIAQRISASLDLQQVLQTTAEEARRLVRADVTGIALTDGSTNLPPATLVGNRTEELERLVVPAGSGLTALVLQTGSPQQVHWDDDRLGGLRDRTAAEIMAAEGVISTLVVPVNDGDLVVGMFWVHSRTRREFMRSEIALLQRLASQASIGIANARAHADEQRARAKEAEARAEVEALLAATAGLGAEAEPDAVLRTLIERAAKLLETDRAVYAILKDGRRIIPGHWQNGEWIDDVHEVYERGINRLVWDSGVPYRSNNLAADPNAAPRTVEHWRLRSQLSVPLKAPTGEVLGVISLTNSRRAEGFVERDERLLVAICDTAAAILQRANETSARLEAQHAAARRKEEIEALLSAADQLNSAMGPQEVLLRVVSIAAQLMNVRRAGIATNEGDHALRRHTYTDGVWRSELTKFPLDTSIAGWVIRNRCSFRSDDLVHSPFTFQPASDRILPESVLAVPVMGRNGDVLGALQLFEPVGGEAFDDDAQRLAEGLAHHAAVALERATLIDELQRREEYLEHQAVTDPLTGLPNRGFFFDRLGQALEREQEKGRSLGVLFLDLDGFKDVNDSLGHHAGDELLKSVAARLVANRRDHDVVARVGGDEFAVLLEEVDQPSVAESVAHRLIDALMPPFSLDSRQLSISASVGVSFHKCDSAPSTAEEVVREADIALYQAKAAGKSQAVLFAPSMSTQAMERLELQTDLQLAPARGELRLYYHPILDLRTGTTIGYEALVRWQHKRRGLMQPAAFIPLAEQTGLILPIGKWVLRNACEQAAVWQSMAPACSPLRVSVNVSAHQFEQPDLTCQLAETLEESRLPPESLILEITETAIIRNPESAIATLRSLRELGVSVAIDDFGIGYSSLSYLERLTVEMLKIDRSFIVALDRSPSAVAIVRATIAMAQALGIEVLAEGIETDGQLETLRALGCDYGQGYLFSLPLPADGLGILGRALR